MYSSVNTKLKELYIAKNLDDLQKLADTSSFSQAQLGEIKICNKILKLYDEAMKLINEPATDGEFDEERCFVYLFRFVDLFFKIRKTKLYKLDKIYVDSMLSNEKIKKSIDLLEKIKNNLSTRYEKLIENDEPENTTLSIETVKPSVEQIVDDDELKEILLKKFITANELVKIFEKTNYKFLIIDCRTSSEFKYSQIDLSYLKLNDPKHERVSYINLNSIYIKTGLVIWKLEDDLRENNEFELIDVLNRRFEYDYVILFDTQSCKADVEAKQDNKLLQVKRALYEFDQSNSKCKREPIVLDGGWFNWLKYYPAYRRTILNSNENSSSDALNSLNSLKLTEIKGAVNDTGNKISTGSIGNDINDKIFTLDFDNSDIDENEENASSEEVVVKPSVNIPNVNRANKPSVLAPSNSKPSIMSIVNDEVPKPIVPKVPLKPQQLTTTTTTTPIIPNVLATLPTNVISNSSDNSLLFQKPNSNVVLTNPAFFNAIYKPTTENIYFAKPIQTSVMKGGGVKYIDQITGLSSYVYDKENQVRYSIDDVIPNNLLNQQIQKPTPRPQPLIKPQKQEITKPIPGPKPVLLDRKSISGDDSTSQSNLKRTYSSPNIAKLDENEEYDNMTSDDENDYKPEVAKPTVTVPTTTTVTTTTTTTTTPTITSTTVPSATTTVTPATLLSQTVNTVVNADKPNINRGNKPMPDHIKRLRLENLDPQWSNVQPGLTGIRNIGNTCFMNSIIQCLNNTKQLKDYFLSANYRNDLNKTNPLGFNGEIADEFSIIVYALWWGHCKTIAPKHFKAIIGQFNTQFLTNEQQDAQEFLLFLLDGLHEDLNKVFFNFVRKRVKPSYVHVLF